MLFHPFRLIYQWQYTLFIGFYDKLKQIKKLMLHSRHIHYNINTTFAALIIYLFILKLWQKDYQRYYAFLL